MIQKGRIGRRERVEINEISERTAATDLKDSFEKDIFTANNGRG